MRELEPCGVCQEQYSPEDLAEFGDIQICQSCLESETVTCHRCGERIWLDDDEGNENIHLCPSCYERYYTTCVDCGRIIPQDDAYYLDEDDYEARCYHCHSNRCNCHVIRDYFYKPEPIFYGEGNRYYGVELEIDEAGESDRNAGRLMEIANYGGAERLYCKHDGSLEAGYELVSHPMSLTYHMTQMPWADILASAKSMGYRSHQTTTCGLHIQVSRAAFGETEAEQEASIARVLYFFEKHWEELLKFSRRTKRQLERWAKRYGLKEQPGDILKHAKGFCGGDRYTCVNLTNTNTIEFRMFRGTLKQNTLIATLQLVDRICDVAISLTDEELKAMSWTTFVSGCTQPELVQYLKERRLYVNEPVEAEVEV